MGYHLYMDLVMTSMEVVLDSLEDTASQLQIHNKSSCRHNPAHQGSCVARIIQDQLTTEEQILFAVRQIVFVRFFTHRAFTQAVSTQHHPSECYHTTAVTKPGLSLQRFIAKSVQNFSLSQILPFFLNYLKLL